MVVYPQHTTKQTQCHTPAEAGQVQDKTQDCTATHTPQPSIFHDVYKDETNMVPHTCFSGYLHCAIPDPTNAQIRPRVKHGSMQPPRPLTLDYPHLTKQIRCHTPTLAAPLSLHETPSDEWPEKAYSEIRSAQPIRPQPLSLKNYNTTTNQIRHTPTSAGTFPP
ncbi:hypothetical protein BS47DRAFT_1367136 [Hydnum rufescens UP504]|uniref:Uncharacterized protein n=1 Tax=Hydnum rufescens UP504 TaxID=1448309 RepID=A0A9P6AK10_9AGAM|nr:hypothetical protein BS47DRAFT_1367136 [Hydnum rufescens UP504]